MKVRRKIKPEYTYLVTIITAMDDVPLMITTSPQAARGKAMSVKVKEIDEALVRFHIGGATLFYTAVTVFKYVGTMAYAIKSTPYENRYIEAHNEALAQKKETPKSRMRIKRKKK